MALCVLRTKGWLSRLSPEFQERVLTLGRQKNFKAGATVFSIGDLPGGVYGLLEGAVAASIAPKQSGPHQANVSRPGWWFGETAFITGQARRVSIEAVSDIKLFYLSHRKMDLLVREDPEWIRRFVLILVENFDLALHALDDLMMPDPAHRIAATLIRCVGSQHESGTVRISQDALGRLSNTSRKVVNRTIARFAAEGLVRQGYGEIHVLSIDQLRACASREP